MFDLLHFDSRNFHVHRAINIHERLVGLITYFTYFGGIVVPLWMVDWKRWSCFLIEIQWGNMFSSNTYHYCLTVNNHMSKIYKYRMNPTGICFLNVNLLNFSFKILSITRKRYIFFFKRNTLHDSCIHKNVFEPVSPKKNEYTISQRNWIFPHSLCVSPSQKCVNKFLVMADTICNWHELDNFLDEQ